MLDKLSQYGPAGVSVAMLVILLKLLWPNLTQLFGKGSRNGHNGNGATRFIEISFEKLMEKMRVLDKLEGDVDRNTTELFGNQRSPGGGIVGEIAKIRESQEELSDELADIGLQIERLKQADSNMVTKFDLEVAFRFFREEMRKEYVTQRDCDLKERNNRPIGIRKGRKEPEE